MSSYTYGFVNARIGAMKSQLLDDAEVKSMVESRNLDDALALLKNTAYAKDMAKLSSQSLGEIENVFSNSLLSEYEKLAISVTGVSKTFLAHYAKRFEIDSLKMLLIMKSKGEDLKKHPWLLQRIMTVPAAEKLVEMETPEEAVEMLRFTKYYPLLHKAIAEYSEQGTAYPFISALDTYYYGTLNTILKKMTGKDRGIAERLIGIEVDAKNLFTALRIRGTGEKDLFHWLVPMRYHLTDSELMAAFNVKRLNELPQVLKYYTDIISRGVKDYEKSQSLFALEQEFRKYILMENNRVFGGDRFHLGVSLAYLHLKENEIRNLTSILHGKEEELPTLRIEETVILAA